MNKLAHSASALAVLLLLALTLAATPLAAQAPTGDPTLTPAGWQTITAQGFEGAFPVSGWTITDVSNDGWERFWGRDDFKPHGGTWSAWPASGGAAAVDPEFNPYPNNMNTRMIYGPFDLSDALAAKVTFWLWLETETEYGDSAYFGISRDGSLYSEYATWEGTFDWTEIPVDLATYVGDNSVWVRWDFYSDSSIALGGAFVDDITIEKQVLDAPAVTISRSGSNIVLSWAPVDGATGYQVWWGVNAPYFTPGSTCPAATCAISTGVSYPHANPVDAANNYTYVVLAVKGAVRSAPTNRVGEFDFNLTR